VWSCVCNNTTPGYPRFPNTLEIYYKFCKSHYHSRWITFEHVKYKHKEKDSSLTEIESGRSQDVNGGNKHALKGSSHQLMTVMTREPLRAWADFSISKKRATILFASYANMVGFNVGWPWTNHDTLKFHSFPTRDVHINILYLLKLCRP